MEDLLLRNRYTLEDDSMLLHLCAAQKLIANTKYINEVSALVAQHRGNLKLNSVERMDAALIYLVSKALSDRLELNAPLNLETISGNTKGFSFRNYCFEIEEEKGAFIICPTSEKTKSSGILTFKKKFGLYGLFEGIDEWWAEKKQNQFASTTEAEGEAVYKFVNRYALNKKTEVNEFIAIIAQIIQNYDGDLEFETANDSDSLQDLVNIPQEANDGHSRQATLDVNNLSDSITFRLHSGRYVNGNHQKICLRIRAQKSQLDQLISYDGKPISGQISDKTGIFAHGLQVINNFPNNKIDIVIFNEYGFIPKSFYNDINSQGNDWKPNLNDDKESFSFTRELLRNYKMLSKESISSIFEAIITYKKRNVGEIANEEICEVIGTSPELVKDVILKHKDHLRKSSFMLDELSQSLTVLMTEDLSEILCDENYGDMQNECSIKNIKQSLSL